MKDLTLKPISQNDYPLVQHIEVAPEQIIYSGTIGMAFELTEPGVDFHLISQGDQVLGFFKIDHKFPQKYAFSQIGDLGLRAFMVDITAQNRGVCTQTLLAMPNYLKQHYPQAHALVFMVNLRNHSAMKCYLNAGCRNTNDIQTGGIAGPQTVMRLDLNK